MAQIDPDNLRLTDFMDLPTLQEIQDSFAAIANVRATITDADGWLLTQPAPTKDFLRRQRAIEQAEDGQDAAEGPSRAGAEYVAPIMVNNQRLGTIRMSAKQSAHGGIDEAKIQSIAARLGLDPRQIKSVVSQLNRARNMKPAAIQFLYLLANAIARLCFQEFQLRQRMNELTAVYNVTMMLSESRDLTRVLQRTTQVVCELMSVHASSIRLLNRDNDQLHIAAVHNLSAEYLAKGPVRLSTAEIERVALSAKGFEFVRDLTDDPRVLYPEEARREGIVSMLSVGMRYKGRPVGVLRVYTDKEQVFGQLQIDLLKAVAAQAAAAIENTRLLEETLAAEALERQVGMARDVQQRLLPASPPQCPGFDFAADYRPCHALGGDFYDFIQLPDANLGLVMADVSGKGVPASLIMATVRSALRAHVDNIYYLYEVMGRINTMLCRDTKPGEFVTLFYGVLDTRNRRLTYCSAGHPPGLLRRDGAIIELRTDNMVLGVEPSEQYRQSVLDLRPKDTLLLFTDGLTDAMNFGGEIYGRQRVADVFIQDSPSAEATVQHILWDMRRFTGLTQRTDDITMIVAQVK